MDRRAVTLAAAALAIACVARVAVAAPAKPWAEGVPAGEQQQALALYDKGNGFFAQDQFAEALAQYREALRHWDHPAIRYNAAVCEMDLGRDADAYDDLVAAMRFGAEPIGADHFAQAKTYLLQLDGRLGQLVVTSDQAGVEIRLDGQRLLTGPGTVTRRVPAGEHQIVGEKPHFQTETRTVPVTPARATTVAIALAPVVAPRRLVRRWATWKPWAVVAGGAVVAALGIPLWHAARTHDDSYDGFVAACAARHAPDLHCPDDEIPGSVSDLKSRADLEGKAEIAAFVAGGALVAAGVAMVVWNQPHLETPVVAPAIGPDHVGVTLVGRW